MRVVSSSLSYCGSGSTGRNQVLRLPGKQKGTYRRGVPSNPFSVTMVIREDAGGGWMRESCRIQRKQSSAEIAWKNRQKLEELHSCECSDIILIILIIIM